MRGRLLRLVMARRRCDDELLAAVVHRVGRHQVPVRVAVRGRPCGGSGCSGRRIVILVATERHRGRLVGRGP